MTDPSPPVPLAEHLAAFNAGDLNRLVSGFTRDAVWTTGAYSCRGESELRELFAGAFAAIAPNLQLRRWVADMAETPRLVAAELSEMMTVDGRTVHAPIAGFYTITDGLISAAKIYREGSAEIPDADGARFVNLMREESRSRREGVRARDHPREAWLALVLR